MIKTYKYKLYKSKKNKRLHRTIGICAYIWNHCIALMRRYFKMYKKHLGLYSLLKHITKLKKLSKYSFWNLVGSQAIQDIAERIDRSYKLFFRNLKAKIKTNPPNFCATRFYTSFTLKQTGYKLLDDNKFKIGETIYKYSKSRDIEGKIKTVTIKRDTLGDIYIYFACDLGDIKVQESSNIEAVGIDFGLKTFLTLNNGLEVESPQFYKNGRRILKRAQQALCSKIKGSNNRKREVLNVARRHKEITNQRKDHHYKIADWLIKQYKAIYIEDLCLKGMQRLWGRKINDLAFGNFVQILEWKCIKAGVKLLKIDRYYPSSKTCNICLTVKEDLTLKDRQWKCNNCNIMLHRDINAAINIYNLGIA